jgi:phosphoribosylamine--glycine ligase (EC 6.3.4.13)
MNVMVIGSGGREDVISEAIHRSDKLGSLYAVMKNRNPGIASRCEDFLLAKETDVERVVDYALLKKIDLAVIGPEAPLEKGIVDSLEENGIDAIGPKKIPAKIETDKSWARQLMRGHNIGGLSRVWNFQRLRRGKGVFG